MDKIEFYSRKVYYPPGLSDGYDPLDHFNTIPCGMLTTHSANIPDHNVGDLIPISFGVKRGIGLITSWSAMDVYLGYEVQIQFDVEWFPIKPGKLVIFTNQEV